MQSKARGHACTRPAARSRAQSPSGSSQGPCEQQTGADVCRSLKVWPHRQMLLQLAGCGSCANAVSGLAAQQPAPCRQAAAGQVCDGQYLVQDIARPASQLLHPWQGQPWQLPFWSCEAPQGLLEDQTTVKFAHLSYLKCVGSAGTLWWPPRDRQRPRSQTPAACQCACRSQ